jgi:RNA polymerase sigma factor (sigma-70 family)
MDQDAELLRCYLDDRSELSFAALVRRHLPLVYSTALRQVGGDSHRAQEVAQAVFTLFARKADKLRSHPAPAGWLYTCTHFLSAKARRSEQRRLRYEREAQAMEDPAEDATAMVDWDRLRPVIDEAMIGLKEHDRTAVLLRFFENRSYAEIGAQLSVTENTARMRVDRALDALRSVLERRGISSAVAALGAALSSQATVAIPTGLPATITSGAAATAAGGIAIFMGTTFIKTAAVAAIALAAATGLLLQHREIEKLRAENVQLQQRSTLDRARSDALPRPSTVTLETEIERLQTQVELLKSNSASSWQERAGLLREVLGKLPEQSIPELQLATDDDWLDAAKEKLETADDYRRALAKLRSLAISRFAHLVQPALTKYYHAHGQQFPTDVSQLQPLLGRSIDKAILQRYVIAAADTVANVRMGGELIITPSRVVDPTYDGEFVIGPNGFGSSSYGASEMAAIHKAWEAANPGAHLGNPMQLLPYATTAKGKAAIERAIELEHKKSQPSS